MTLEEKLVVSRVKVVKCENTFNWWHDQIGKVFKVWEYREEWDDFIVDGGNCIDFSDVFIMPPDTPYVDTP